MDYLNLDGGRCLDFGGGGGVFLLTLSARFDSVTCLDLETRDAAQLVKFHGLGNVTIRESDVASEDFSHQPFDAIVAADVLEHFRDLNGPVTALRSWLRPKGILFTSLPTENWVYATLRKIFGITKPEDHFHAARQVELFLGQSGFVPLRKSYLPLFIPFAALFHITAWRYAGD